MFAARVRYLAVLGGVCIISVACSSSSEPPTSCRAGATVVVSVSASATPEFTWSPDCLVYRLEVSASGSENVTWWIEGTIPSGVRYGEAPAGATGMAAEPLVRGRAYTVAVLRLGADAESNFYETLGYKDFVQR
ncbi:MAG: hypothetical protein H6Q77_1975 [Gemmatimonadetes bacterium]|nr:hypothetical protein [Gemmatimonadota bacterium]